MAMFEHAGLDPDRIAEFAALANASYAGSSPPSGWSALTGAQLGFSEGFGTGTYDNITYESAAIWFGGSPQARTYLNGSELTVSFRGTDAAWDFATYPDIVGDNYLNAFTSYLETVKAYAEANGITQVYVTGHSLGAAAANILRNLSASEFDGFFDDSIYVTIATPKVSSNPDILNIGFENDWVFKAVPRLTPFTATDFTSSTDNLLLFDLAYSDPDFPGAAFDPSDTSAHAATGYIDAIERIVDSYWYEDIGRDSVVVVSNSNEWVTDKETDTSDHFGESAYYIGRGVGDKFEGNDEADWFDGRGGADRARGSGGDDHFIGKGNDDTFFGGDGEDTAYFRFNCDEYDFEKNEDGTVTVTHARPTSEITDGTDTLVDVEVAQFANFAMDLTLDELGCMGQDLAFVIDTTGSMSDDIAAVKASAVSIINSIFDASRGLANSRVAVVGFNDPVRSSTLLSFTDQVDPEDRKAAALSAINSISVGGGGDFPEYTYSGLRHALDGSAGAWREDASSRKIVLFGDATAKDPELASEVFALAADLNVDLPGAAASRGEIEVASITDGVSMMSYLAERDASGAVVPVQIFTVAIGSNPSTRAEYEDIAGRGGGAYFEAAGSSEIVEALLEVINLPIYRIDAVEDRVREGDSGNRRVEFVIARDVADNPSEVTLAIGGDVDADDYGDLPETISFEAGEMTKTVTVQVRGDTDVEQNEDMTLSIVGVDEAGSIGVSSATTVIRNDDEPNLVRGSGGSDVLKGTEEADVMLGLKRADLLKGRGGDDDLRGGKRADVLQGGDGDDRLLGRHGADLLSGGEGDDRLEGRFGDDVLVGGRGDDVLVGGAGADKMTGGPGSDVFLYEAVRDSLPGTEDKIRDFVSGKDAIDLSAIDAVTTDAGDTAFLFVADAAFSSTEGELRYADDRLSGDIDGDGVEDFAIAFASGTALVGADLIL